MSRLWAEHPDLAGFLRDTPEDVARGSDALVLVTSWPAYLELDWSAMARQMRNPLVLDGRHALDRGRLTAAGFRYVALAAWNPPV